MPDVYKWQFVLGLGGRNTKRRPSISLHTEGQVDLDAEETADAAVAAANALRAGLLVSTAIVAVKVSHISTGAAVKVENSDPLVVPVELFGSRLVGAVPPEVPESVPDYVSIEVRCSPRRGRVAILRMAGAVALSEVSVVGGQFEIAQGSTLPANVEAAWLAVRTALIGTPVIPQTSKHPSRVIVDMLPGAVVDYDRVRETSSLAEDQEKVAAKEIRALVHAANLLNPEAESPFVGAQSVNSALAKIVLDLKAILARHTGEILAELIELIPAWLLELLV